MDFWLNVPSYHQEIFVITSTNSNKHGCKIGGTNVWKLNNDGLSFSTNVHHDEEVLELHNTHLQKKEHFYVLTASNSVEEYTVYGNKIEEWKILNGEGKKRAFCYNDFI